MKPSLPKGTRDFLPEQVLKRNYIFDTIKKVFIKYGFLPIETPTLENLSTLPGQYGEEGDKLLFKVLNSGDYLKKANPKALEEKDSTALIPSISDRGLRYDLTVPFARFVVMHQNDLAFPFTRYQIQPVWRADRPQKGRYREFYQCDADVVGSDSLMYEAELMQIYEEVFDALNIDVIIKINNRKILAGMAEAAGISDQFMDMTMAIDKLDKIGKDGVRNEMTKRGVSDEAVTQIEKMLEVRDLNELKVMFANSPTGLKGIEELEAFHSYFDLGQTSGKVKFDITLARGLNYYTGCIFEVEANKTTYPKLRMGSLGGGGRYADLTSVFGKKDLSGVGISFGAARIYDVMEELDLFPKDSTDSIAVLFVAFDDGAHKFAFKCLSQLRAVGINGDIYPEPAKMNKQMKYANARNVPFVALVGSNEMEKEVVTLKDMKAGTQSTLNIEELISKFKS
jgi:histidyl-tRNA synthetase